MGNRSILLLHRPALCSFYLDFKQAWQNTDLTTAIPKDLRLKHDSLQESRQLQGQTGKRKNNELDGKPTRKPKKLTGLEKRFANLALLLCVETFARWPLELRFLDSKVYATWENISKVYNYPRDLPLKVIFEESQSFLDAPKEKSSLAFVTGRPDDRGHDVLGKIDLTYGRRKNLALFPIIFKFRLTKMMI